MFGTNESIASDKIYNVNKNEWSNPTNHIAETQQNEWL